MPIEIRELIIKAVVKDEQEEQVDEVDAAAGNISNDFLMECAEQVLKILEQKVDR